MIEEMLGRSAADQKASQQVKFEQHRCRLSIILPLMLALLVSALSSAAVHPAESVANSLTLPEGFIVTEIVSGLEAPVDMEFLPGGDILVAEKGRGTAESSTSAVKLVHNGAVQSKPVLTLSTNTTSDSGLLALVLDPAFAANQFFYVWYATGDKVDGWTGNSSMRLSRFKLDLQSGTADPGSEQIILEDNPWADIHHGNSPIFDAQGNLLLGMGNRRILASSQDLSNLMGKVIRIRPTAAGYEIPQDNPYLNRPGIRPEIFASGLRNPYRIADRASDGLLVIGDVGDATWEEINLLQSGKNYGYPEREGPCPWGHTQPCRPSPAYLIDPIITYPHDGSLGDGQSGAVTGMDFYEGTDFPVQYRQKLFFADFNQAFIAVADVSNGTFEIFAAGASNLVDIEYYNEGLYLLDVRPGSISLVSHTGSNNQIPTASLSAAPLQGSAPLQVDFSAEGSHDPDDIALRYHWDFGDGSAQKINDTPNITHTYEKDGTYEVRLQVVDIRGGESAIAHITITVYSGEYPQIKLENLTDPGRAQFHGGDDIAYAAARSNLDGLDPDEPFSWDIYLHHNEHAHSIYTDIVAPSGTLTISRDNHGGDWNIWYRFYLTMKTDQGQDVTLYAEVFPQLVDLSLRSSPTPTEVYWNSAMFRTPQDFKSIVGVKHALSATDHLIYEQEIWSFSGWRIGETFTTDGPAIEIIAPATATDYIATYEYDRPAQTAWMPLLVR